MTDLKQWSMEKLLNNIYIYYGARTVPVGVYPIEYYLEEVIRRNPDTKLYHSDLTAKEQYDIEMKKKKKY